MSLSEIRFKGHLHVKAVCNVIGRATSQLPKLLNTALILLIQKSIRQKIYYLKDLYSRLSLPLKRIKIDESTQKYKNICPIIQIFLKLRMSLPLRPLEAD